MGAEADPRFRDGPWEHRVRRGTRGTPQGVWTYALLQVPGTLIAGLLLWLAFHWGWLSLPWAVGLLLMWVGKDILLYPLVRNVFDPLRAPGPPLVGACGVVEAALTPHGLIRLEGELWQAEPFQPGEAIGAGTPVRVRSARGLVLLVEAEPASEPHPFV